MTRPLLIAAALLALVAPAQAGAELPAEFVGQWCDLAGEGTPEFTLVRRRARGCGREQQQWFIHRDRYELGYDGPGSTAECW